MYLANTHGRGFFEVPRDYEKWSTYEQMLEWSQRAARAADDFRLVVRRIDRLPDGAAKAAFQKRVGTRADRHSPFSLYEWIWHHAAEPNPHVWVNPQAQDRVEHLEAFSRGVKKDMKSQGLGEMAWTKVNPWVWIVTGGVGVIGLGYMLFRKKGR